MTASESMNWLAFLAAWIRAVADVIIAMVWPATLVVFVVIFRSPLMVLADRLSELGIGGATMKFNRSWVRAEATQRIVDQEEAAVVAEEIPDMDEQVAGNPPVEPEPDQEPELPFEPEVATVEPASSRARPSIGTGSYKPLFDQRFLDALGPSYTVGQKLDMLHKRWMEVDYVQRHKMSLAQQAPDMSISSAWDEVEGALGEVFQRMGRRMTSSVTAAHELGFMELLTPATVNLIENLAEAHQAARNQWGTATTAQALQFQDMAATAMKALARAYHRVSKVP